MEIIITVKENNSESVSIKVNGSSLGPNFGVSQYGRFFDNGCPGWNTDSECTLLFLKQQQAYANDLLRSRGHIFLNEIYDMLGIPRTKIGQIVGWVYDEKNPIGDNYISFDIYGDQNVDFVNGRSDKALLDFNVDGNILDRIKEIES